MKLHITMTIKSYLCNMELYLKDDSSCMNISVSGGLPMHTFQNSFTHQKFGLIIGRMKLEY